MNVYELVDKGTTWNDQSGYVSYKIGKFDFVVDGYDAEEYSVFIRDRSALPIFVRMCDIPRPRGTDRMEHWDTVCERAYRAAIQQARA